MSTPENNIRPKNYITTPIGKQLLTSCRRVGLSRSKRTPKKFEATCKSPSNTTKPQNKAHNESNRSTEIVKIRAEKQEISTSSAKVKNENRNSEIITIIQHSDTKPKAEIGYNRPDEESPPQQSLTIKTVAQIEVPPSVKRSINFDKPEEVISNKRMTNAQNIKKKISDNFPITTSKRKLDNTGSDNNKCKKLNTTGDTYAENKKQGIKLERFNTEDYLNEYCRDPETFKNNFESEHDSFDYVKGELVLKEAKSEALEKQEKKKLIVSLELLEPETIKELNEGSRNATLVKSKSFLNVLQSNFIGEEENIFTSSLNISDIEENLDGLKQANNNDFSLVKGVKQEKKKHKETFERFEAKSLKIKENFRTVKSKLSIPTVSKINLDEEDDVFSSSPQSEKQERENLLKLVEKIEKDIKGKEDKLDRLKQAKVYKEKYSPEKLKNPVDQWIQGCKAGLLDLLVKMQEFGPMDMDSLLKKLNIPSDILKRLNFSKS